MANVTFQKRVTPASQEQVTQFEKRNAVPLPASYRKFLTSVNGGEPTPDKLPVPGWRGNVTCVNRFYGLGEGGYYDLEKTLQGAEDYVPAGHLPIAEDSAGNLICMGIGGPAAGNIYFWDHEGPQNDDPANLIRLADDFDRFLDSLLPADG